MVPLARGLRRCVARCSWLVECSEILRVNTNQRRDSSWLAVLSLKRVGS
jgi:hypothetical protein